jgi:hypothetical protein
MPRKKRFCIFFSRKVFNDSERFWKSPLQPILSFELLEKFFLTFSWNERAIKYDGPLSLNFYLVRSLVCSFIRSFLPSFIRSFVRSFLHSFLRSSVRFLQSWDWKLRRSSINTNMAGEFGKVVIPPERTTIWWSQPKAKATNKSQTGKKFSLILMPYWRNYEQNVYFILKKMQFVTTGSKSRI